MRRSKEGGDSDGVPAPEPGNGTSGLKMKREIGLWSAVSFSAGCMIGSGIFMSPQGVLVHMGSPGGSLVVWAVCGLLAMLGALCFAELGAFIPESGGEYAYILRTFGSLPGFLVAYTYVLVGRPAAISAVSLTFAEYALAPFYPGCTLLPQVAVKCAAASCILLLMMVNLWSSRLATLLMNVCTASKTFSLLIIVVGGAVVLAQGRGHTEVFLSAFQNTTLQAGSIGMAFYQGLWSFEGWGSINYVTEELKNPKNLLWAVIIAIPMVTSLYLLVNISYLLVLLPSEILSSKAMAVVWGNQILGSWAWIMPIAVSLSTFGSVNGTFFGGSRVCFAAAREGHMPSLLSMLHVQRLTPAPALMFTTFVALILLIPGDFRTIVNLLSLMSWITYGVTFSCLLYLRIKTKNTPRTLKVPMVILVIMLLASFYLVLAPIIDDPQMEMLYLFLFLLSGIPVYFLFLHFQCQPKCLQKATLHLQLLFEVAPTRKDC